MTKRVQEQMTSQYHNQDGFLPEMQGQFITIESIN